MFYKTFAVITPGRMKVRRSARALGRILVSPISQCLSMRFAISRLYIHVILCMGSDTNLGMQWLANVTYKMRCWAPSPSVRELLFTTKPLSTH